MTKFCPDCGAAIVDNSKFCKNCGKDVSNLQHHAPQQTFAAPQNPNVPPVVEKDYTIWIIVGTALSIIFPIAGMGIGAYIMTRKENPKNETYGLIIMGMGLICLVISILFVLSIWNW